MISDVSQYTPVRKYLLKSKTESENPFIVILGGKSVSPILETIKDYKFAYVKNPCNILWGYEGTLAGFSSNQEKNKKIKKTFQKAITLEVKSSELTNKINALDRVRCFQFENKVVYQKYSHPNSEKSSIYDIVIFQDYSHAITTFLRTFRTSVSQDTLFIFNIACEKKVLEFSLELKYFSENEPKEFFKPEKYCVHRSNEHLEPEVVPGTDQFLGRLAYCLVLLGALIVDNRLEELTRFEKRKENLSPKSTTHSKKKYLSGTEDKKISSKEKEISKKNIEFRSIDLFELSSKKYLLSDLFSRHGLHVFGRDVNIFKKLVQRAVLSIEESCDLKNNNNKIRVYVDKTAEDFFGTLAFSLSRFLSETGYSKGIDYRLKKTKFRFRNLVIKEKELSSLNLELINKFFIVPELTGDKMDFINRYFLHNTIIINDENRLVDLQTFNENIFGRNVIKSNLIVFYEISNVVLDLMGYLEPEKEKVSYVEKTVLDRNKDLCKQRRTEETLVFDQKSLRKESLICSQANTLFGFFSYFKKIKLNFSDVLINTKSLRILCVFDCSLGLMTKIIAFFDCAQEASNFFFKEMGLYPKPFQQFKNVSSYYIFFSFSFYEDLNIGKESEPYFFSRSSAESISSFIRNKKSIPLLKEKGITFCLPFETIKLGQLKDNSFYPIFFDIKNKNIGFADAPIEKIFSIDEKTKIELISLLKFKILFFSEIINSKIFLKNIKFTFNFFLYLKTCYSFSKNILKEKLKNLFALYPLAEEEVSYYWFYENPCEEIGELCREIALYFLVYSDMDDICFETFVVIYVKYYLQLTKDSVEKIENEIKKLIFSNSSVERFSSIEKSWKEEIYLLVTNLK